MHAQGVHFGLTGTQQKPEAITRITIAVPVCPKILKAPPEFWQILVIWSKGPSLEVMLGGSDQDQEDERLWRHPLMHKLLATMDHLIVCICFVQNVCAYL